MKIKNRNLHKKRYLENKNTFILFTHDKRPHTIKGFSWISSTDSNAINDMKEYLERRKMNIKYANAPIC